MTKFEEDLISLGYLVHTLNCKTMKYEKGRKLISTMVNIDHRYIHKDDKVLLDKIEKGISVMEDEFTPEDRKSEICFGLHEHGKPPTLISPQPSIKVKRNINGQLVTENETLDNSMNVVLRGMSFKKIYEAMFDKSIVLEIDLTNNES